MIDVALVPTGETIDLVVEDGDLRLEAGLFTACLVSLFSDGLAAADDELPDGVDRRGWWAGEVTPDDRGDFFGSRLWLLERSTLANATLAAAEAHGREALEWLVREGIAERVEVTASRLDRTTLFLSVQVVRGSATARRDLWTAQLAASVAVGPTRFSLVAIP